MGKWKGIDHTGFHLVLAGDGHTPVKRRTKTHKDTDNFFVTVGAYESG
jgi:hypothetical protein